MAARPRIVFFSSGSPMSQAALRAIERDVVRVITPPEMDETPECDLICIASFSRIVPRSILSRASIGGLNVHGSLLPRHRGVDPLFWTFFDDDAEAGVTLHWIDEGVDSGDIVAQRHWPLPRGTRATDLYMRQATEGAEMLASAIATLDTLPRAKQDASLATHDPSPNQHTWCIDYATWPAERVWHFLHGMSPLRRDLLDVGYTPEFTLTNDAPARPPGTIETRGSDILVHCKDAIVRGKRPPLRTRVKRWLTRTS